MSEITEIALSKRGVGSKIALKKYEIIWDFNVYTKCASCNIREAQKLTERGVHVTNIAHTLERDMKG